MSKKIEKSVVNSSRPYVEDYLKNQRSNITLVDLFAGIGGFHYGIGAAAKTLGMGVETLLVSEIEDSCRNVYEINHGNPSTIQGDINEIPLRKFAKDEADILTAGFPCQPFSNSGRKLGLSDPRGQFYDRIEEIIKAFKSRAFILENVPGITKNGGKNFQSELAVKKNQHVGLTMHMLEQAMKKGLQSSRQKKSNYNIKWLEINSSEFGSPQVRKRVYIIGVRADLGEVPDLSEISIDYPLSVFMNIQEESADTSLKLSRTQEQNIRSFMKKGMTPSYKEGMRRVGQAYLCAGGNVGQAYHAYGMVPTLTKVWARFLPIYFPAKGERLPNTDSAEFSPGADYGKGTIRRASVREVMRLQGFPDEFQHHDRDNVAYQHAGNAVNALVIRELSNLLLPIILQ
jgi:DNA-cytosine methyltransferase